MIRDLDATSWRKASASGTQGTECVELHPAGAVRDSKNPTGGVLNVDWTGLVDAAKTGCLAFTD
jgi:hypothetical protein